MKIPPKNTPITQAAITPTLTSQTNQSAHVTTQTTPAGALEAGTPHVQSELLGQSPVVAQSLQSAVPGATVGNSPFGLLQQVARVEEGQSSQTPTFAAIDMGSNSAKMLILRQDADGTMKTIVDHKIGTRLGKNVQPGDPLPAANQERAMKALQAFIAEAEGFGINPEEIGLITTAAVRNSANGEAFIDQLKGDLGLTQAQILTGDQEAEIGYFGALRAMLQTTELPTEARLATLDLGGGSFQLAVGSPEGLEDGGSTQIGSNYILDEIFQGLDVLSDADFARVDTALKEVAPMPLAADALAERTLVATGGVSKFLRAHFGKDAISRDEIDAFRREAGALPEADRADLMRQGKDATSQRALGVDTDEGALDYGKKLPASASLMLHIMDQLGLEKVNVSTTDARHAMVGQLQQASS